MKTKLVVFSGRAGTGKTTAGKRTAALLGCCYFDYDTLAQPFLREVEDVYGIDGSRERFYRRWRSPSYETLWAPVRENLSLGRSLVVAAPFTSEMQDPTFFSRLRKAVAVDLEIFSFQMKPDPQLHERMLLGRRSYRDENVLKKIREGGFNSEFKQAIWDADHFNVISYGDFDSQSSRILKALGF